MIEQTFVNVHTEVFDRVKRKPLLACTFITCWQNALLPGETLSIVALTFLTAYPISVVANITRARVVSVTIRTSGIFMTAINKGTFIDICTKISLEKKR